MDPYARVKHQKVREIFRDDTLWILDKPGGVLSHPNLPAERASNALIRGVYDFERELYRVAIPGERQRQVHLVHRLDQETSGLIICVFAPEAASLLKEALFRGGLDKEYRALVLGGPTAKRGEWRDCLRKTPGRGSVSVQVVHGRPNATTRFEVLERIGGGELTLLSLRPETGRTHQLRVQTSSRGFPIAGDERYGDFVGNRYLTAEIGLRHMFLHASRLRFRHPRTGHLLSFEAPFTTRLSAPLERARGLRGRIPRRR